MTKLCIDLKNGTLEVEGEEMFVQEVYSDYKKEILEGKSILMREQASLDAVQKPEQRKHISGKTSGKRKESYQLVRNLDVFASGDKPSLKDFYVSKSPSSAMEKNAVFIFYLTKTKEEKDIGVDHIYTCYKEVGEKVPGALRQSLVDTASKKNWIDTKSMDDITMAIGGENLVEHELPRKIIK